MRRTRFERLGIWVIGALTSLLIHDLGLTRSARAECGALAASALDRLHDFNGLDALVVDGLAASPSGVHEARSDEAPEPPPCSGPSCSDKRPTPASTAAPDIGHLDRWGDLSARRVGSTPPSRHRAADGPALHPEGHKPSIFHPPPLGTTFAADGRF